MVEMVRAKFPLTPALSPAERENHPFSWALFWFESNSTFGLICAWSRDVSLGIGKSAPLHNLDAVTSQSAKHWNWSNKCCALTLMRTRRDEQPITTQLFRGGGVAFVPPYRSNLQVSLEGPETPAFAGLSGRERRLPPHRATVAGRWQQLIKCAGLSMVVVVTATGCSMNIPGRMAAKTIQTVGSVAEKTTVTAVKTTGKVTLSTSKAVVSTSGAVAKGLASATFVTFKDTAGGVSREVPYRDGLRLYAASQNAKLNAGLQGFQLVRNGLPVMKATWSSVKPGTRTDPVLKPGDVVQLTRVRREPTGRTS